jgi:hypothetical protein
VLLDFETQTLFVLRCGCGIGPWMLADRQLKKLTAEG